MLDLFAWYQPSKEHLSKNLSILRFEKIFATHADKIAEKFRLIVPNIYSIKNLLERISKKSLYDKCQQKTTLKILQEYFFLKIVSRIWIKLTPMRDN